MMEHIQQAKAVADDDFRQGKSDAAVVAYSRALDLSEQHQIADLLHLLYSNRSAAKLALQDYQGALADAQAAVAIDETWVKGWFRSAKALQGLNKLDLALQAAAKAQQLVPTNKDVRLLLQQLTQQQQQQSRSQPHSPPPQQPQQQQQQTPDTAQLPWRELNTLRSKPDLKCLPNALVAGSRYIPSPDGVNQNLLLLLHGLGDTPAGFTALAERMGLPQTACLALSGPLAVPETDGGRMWLEAFEADGELIQGVAGEARRIESLAATLVLMQQLLFEALPAVRGWQPGQIQLLGFSQGGCVALELARMCKGSRQLGGVVAVAAGLLPEALAKEAHCTGSTGAGSSTSVTAGQGSTGNSSSSGSGTPVLITYGDRDELITRDRVDRTVTALKKAGCPVELKVVAGKGHSMIGSEGEMRSCMQFWAQTLKHRPADADFEEVK